MTTNSLQERLGFIGLDAKAQAQIDRGKRIIELFKQPQYNPVPVDVQVAVIWAVQNQYMDRVPVNRIPYVVDMAVQDLGGTKHLILAGANAPVGFFAYPGKPSTMWPKDCVVHTLAAMDQDIVGALEALADELGAPKQVAIPDTGSRPEIGSSSNSTGAS